jgi:hypothetical protein
MPDPDTETERDSTGSPPEPVGVATTESYETDEGVVFYDAENPIAWIQSDGAIDLDEVA